MLKDDLNKVNTEINNLENIRELLNARMAQLVSLYNIKENNLPPIDKNLEYWKIKINRNVEEKYTIPGKVPIKLPKVQPWINVKPKKPPVPPANTNVGYIPEPEPSNTNLPPGQPKGPPPPPIGMGIIRNPWILFMKRNKGRFQSLRELSREYHKQRYRFF